MPGNANRERQSFETEEKTDDEQSQNSIPFIRRGNNLSLDEDDDDTLTASQETANNKSKSKNNNNNNKTREPLDVDDAPYKRAKPQNSASSSSNRGLDKSKAPTPGKSTTISTPGSQPKSKGGRGASNVITSNHEKKKQHSFPQFHLIIQRNTRCLQCALA